MKKLKLLLLGGVGLLLAGALWWWLAEIQFPPDERKHRAMLRDFHLHLGVAIVRANTPGQWIQAKLGSGGDHLMTRLREKENELVATGYLTNYIVLVTNFPPQATNLDLKVDELSRRVQADPQISADEFTTFTRSADGDDGNITLTCRSCVLSNFIHAMNRP
ncbi:MAG: hypothetical protein AAB370_11900 [Verrucomicrobiota bacterium]